MESIEPSARFSFFRCDGQRDSYLHLDETFFAVFGLTDSFDRVETMYLGLPVLRWRIQFIKEHRMGLPLVNCFHQIHGDARCRIGFYGGSFGVPFVATVPNISIVFEGFSVPSLSRQRAQWAYLA